VVRTETEAGTANLEQLARAAQHGRERAFDRLAEALWPRIRRWALTMVGSADDAEDIAQDVLLKIHRSLGSFGFGSRLTTWVYATTRRTAADFHRRRNRRAGLMASHEISMVEEALRTGMDGLDRAALAGLVRTEFRALPGRQREIFDLADLQGLTVNQIADLLDLNPVTVRVHLHRARTTIRSRILESHSALVEDYD
jgi:RNA polymerase sigma-70 factor (ECF subfamily)